MPALDPSAQAAACTDLSALDALVSECRACPRLVAWREKVATEKRPAFADQAYWGRAVPGFGDARATVAVVGLAPAAHGGNRTGRMFTGDRSGDFLFAALHRTGFANQASSVARNDGMVLTDVRLAAPVRCAPPANRPTAAERHRCAPFLARELELLAPTLRVVVTLGAIGWDALLSTLSAQGWTVPGPRPQFRHRAEVTLHRGSEFPAEARPRSSLVVLGCYHVSPHNTFTGRLTEQMLDDVLERAREIARTDERPGDGGALTSAT